MGVNRIDGKEAQDSSGVILLYTCGNNVILNPMRFEFRLRVGSLAVELSDYGRFVPFQMTLWRYNGSSGHSVCNLRWNSFQWHGWKDRAQIRFTCTPRLSTIRLEPEEEWDEIING